MNILAISDKNPHIDFLGVVHTQKIDLVITLGDLTREDLLPLQTINNTPKIGIYGNHDSGTYMPSLGILDLHLATWDFHGLKFGGFQGCVRYKDSPDALMYTQDQARQMLAGFPSVDIFISHCPPYGINDEPEEIAHQGFLALREYIDTHQPDAWLHGHTYPTADTLISHYGRTRIEYVSGYKLIRL